MKKPKPEGREGKYLMSNTSRGTQHRAPDPPPFIQGQLIFRHNARERKTDWCQKHFSTVTRAFQWLIDETGFLAAPSTNIMGYKGWNMHPLKWPTKKRDQRNTFVSVKAAKDTQKFAVVSLEWCIYLLHSYPNKVFATFLKKKGKTKTTTTKTNRKKATTTTTNLQPAT